MEALLKKLEDRLLSDADGALARIIHEHCH